LKLEPKRLAILALLAALSSTAAWLLGRPQRPERPPRATGPHRAASQEAAPQETEPRPFSGAAGQASQVMGINEAVSLSLDAGQLGTRLHERALLGRRAQQTRMLGSRLVRSSSHIYPYLNMLQLEARDWSWTASDNYFATLAEYGLQAVVVIGPWPGARTASFTETYMPADMVAYEDYVERVVERYDGDGNDDMPGIGDTVVAWEIDNEPDLHNAVPPKGAEGEDQPSSFETPQEYASLLLATARAIRRADPEAFVLSGGIYRPMTPDGSRYLRQVLETPGVPDAIDALSLHCYFAENRLDVVQGTMQVAQELAPNKPVWITETSVPSDGRKPWVDEAWHARMLVAVYGAFLAEGAQRIFWHSLVTPPERRKGQPRGFGSNALLRLTEDDQYADKPAAAVYRRLQAHLSRAELASLREVPIEGGRLLRTSAGWLAFWGEPEAPPGAASWENLLDGEVAPIAGPVQAPAWLEP